ncbi:conserved hypothetical protein [Candidatus Nitrospira nitrificans]|uniref:DUF1902 domain-containing protein n=1 Tax=Candidatus Nitrospira nitrificans TaxID=1742973 RepID=A0A0S4LCA9_9BACT|nr:conserved hypothetical protein [Candidatus Nitrospira nitrificans]
MKIDDLILRCYAEQDTDGTWFAICLDLNLYARGDSFEEVRVKLNKLTTCYLKEAYERDSVYFSDLIPRRAPAYFWARYYLAKCFKMIHRSLASKQDFNMPLPFVPAF